MAAPAVAHQVSSEGWPQHASRKHDVVPHGIARIGVRETCLRCECPNLGKDITVHRLWLLRLQLWLSLLLLLLLLLHCC